MTILFSADNFELKEFYQYPTTVIHRIVEFDEGFHANSPDNVEDVKELFLELIDKAEAMTNRSLRDNKVAMRVIYKPTNTEFYIGYKDWNYSLGLSLNSYSTGNKIALGYA